MELNIIEAVTGPEVIALLALLAANWVLSIVAALAKGVFTFARVADFITTRLLPLVAYLVVAALADFVSGWEAVVVATYAGLVALYSTGILRALKSLTGLKLPAIISEKDKR